MGDCFGRLSCDDRRSSKRFASTRDRCAVIDGLRGDMDRRRGPGWDLGRGRRSHPFQGAERRPARWSACLSSAGVEAPPRREVAMSGKSARISRL